MARKCHYLARNKANQLPASCLWFDTETIGTPNEDGEEVHHLNFGYAAHRRRKNDLHWCAPSWLRFTSLDEFWDWVESHCRDRTRLTIFCHNGQFDLPVLDAFNELPRRGFKMTNAIVEAPPMIITWKRGRQTIKFIDTLNIWAVPLADLGESIGLPKLDMPKSKDSMSAWNAYGRRDTEIIMTACIKWFAFLREQNLGGVSPTLASQAFNAYRHRFMPVKIFLDNKDEALEMSRRAYLGGRVEANRIGEYSGHFYHLDVNSMYPWVMAEHQYPYQLIGTYALDDFTKLGEWLRKYALVADVEINTNEPVYPCVHNNKLVFPTGRLKVTLTSPELSYALEHGHIHKITSLSVYKKANLFSEFVEFAWTERLKALDTNNTLAAWYLKIWANSLYGKWGQRGRFYVKYADTDDMSIKVWNSIHYQTSEVKHWRQFGGMIQHWVENGEATNSFPAIAAHITAEARMALWRLMTLARRENVYYSDTDSILVNSKGYERCKHLIDPRALGALKCEGEYQRVKLYGAKDYQFDELKRVKGVRRKATWVSEHTVEQVRFIGFRGLLRRGHLNAPIVTSQTKNLKRIYEKAVVTKNGHTRPLRFADW